jgi:hypothetical protein
MNVVATIYDMPAAMDTAIRHLNGYVQTEGFPFHDFEVMPVASWYDSRSKEFKYTFRFRWL